VDFNLTVGFNNPTECLQNGQTYISKCFDYQLIQAAAIHAQISNC